MKLFELLIRKNVGERTLAQMIMRCGRYWMFGIFLLFAGGMFARENVDDERPDARKIIRRVVSNYRRDIDSMRDYTYQRRTVIQRLDKNGAVKKTEIRTYEVSIFFGAPFQKLIARDDKPLSAKDRKRSEEKLNNFFNRQKKLSDEDRKREMEKDSHKFQHEIADELPQMLNYEVIGEEMFDGHPVWVIRATPRKDYKPNSRVGKLLSKLSGKVWITKSDDTWVKVEADLAEDFNVGWFLFKLRKGAHLEFEDTRVHDERWMPRRTFINGSGRLAGVTGRFRIETNYSNYRKFTSDVNIRYNENE